MNGARGVDGWLAASLTFFVSGIVLCALSLIDLTPGFGMVQMLQLLLGLTALTLAGFVHMYGRRPANVPRSLQADVGVRLAATGLVLAYVSGFSDLIGIGTHILPQFQRPYVGPWQMTGIVVGVLSITLGMLLYHSSRGARGNSALEFLIPDNGEPPADAR